MKRTLIIVWLGWSIVAAGVAYAVPARPRYERAPQPSKTAELCGSVWDSKDVAEDRLIHFARDGGLIFGVNQTRNGSWRLEGNIVYFEINDGYRMFRGVLLGDRIHGESCNVDATRWQTTLFRVCQDK